MKTTFFVDYNEQLDLSSLGSNVELHRLSVPERTGKRQVHLDKLDTLRIKTDSVIATMEFYWRQAGEPSSAGSILDYRTLKTLVDEGNDGKISIPHEVMGPDIMPVAFGTRFSVDGQDAIAYGYRNGKYCIALQKVSDGIKPGLLWCTFRR